MATAILKQIYDLEVKRTRDQKVLKELDIVYDVGGGEFDHHDIEKVYRESGTPFAACGLIWRTFGREVIRSKESALSNSEVDSIFHFIDSTLIEGIDAIDNGLKTAEVTIPTANITSIISGFNPTWDSEMPEDKAFFDAVDFAVSILENALEQKISVLRARSNVEEAYVHRPVRQVIVLDTYCPWGNTLQQVDKKKEVLFVVYPNREGYAITTVRKGKGTMEARKDLPKAWAGKRDMELGEIIGVEDAVFCHPARFIAGARTLTSIMKMADKAVNEPPEKTLQRILWRFRRLVGK
ncbi:MAG: metal-dependent hydrolase [Clostridiales bacterium]|jgi:uncharacterized UPF0160 family protein|nr:metal-dependent hydrolase [Clostridiales bacterium]